MNRNLRRLLNKVNKVTAYHRHGNPIPDKVLNELVDAQLEFEKDAERSEKIGEQVKDLVFIQAEVKTYPGRIYPVIKKDD